MESLRWANTEPSMHFRETNTDLSVHFRKANSYPSMHFRKANMEFLVPDLLPTLLKNLLPSLFPLYSNVTTNLIHHNKCNVICPSSNSKLGPLYSLFLYIVFFFSAKQQNVLFKIECKSM